MKYIVGYDELFDEVFQCEIDDATAAQLDPGMVEIRDAPRPDIPVTSRYRSERHPGWGSE